MTIQQIVDPAEIETGLIRIWETLAKENKTRASLFNLIVFTRFSPRTDYFRNIVQKVVEKFPCRTLFISHDPDSKSTYLKTAISVVSPQSEASIACDQIDIGVAGPDLERVPFVILPHLIPDLPNYLLWAEDPSVPHPLFAPLSKLATRIIFDSESADSLLAFAKTLLDLKKRTGIDVADLNWARTEGWRDLIASTFDSAERQTLLHKFCFLKIAYNAQETEFFCHLKIQAMYLLAWISSRLHWKFESATPALRFEFKNVDVRIQSENWKKLGPGTIIAVQLHTSDGYLFEAGRVPDEYHHVKIQFSSPEQCDLPYRFVLGQTATGQSLVKEICTKETSSHYLAMLQELTLLDRDRLC
jgi:glucose-6-phosphate dehydrogenase assembly protein OpcA